MTGAPVAAQPPERPIKAVLFDKDGTLIDFQDSWAPWAAKTIAALAKRTGHAAADIAAAMRFDLAAERFHPDSPVIAGTPDALVALLRPFIADVPRQEVMALLTPDADATALAPVAGLRDTLVELAARGVAMAVVTNDFEADSIRQIDALGLSDLLACVIGYDSGFGGKPAPEGCLAAAKRVGVAPRNCVMVGDSLHDLSAGKAAGMVTVGVLTGVASRADLAPHADAVFDDIRGLLSWLSQAPLPRG